MFHPKTNDLFNGVSIFPNPTNNIINITLKAIDNANKVAMSLSDLFCVERHKPHFLSLVKNIKSWGKENNQIKGKFRKKGKFSYLLY